LDPYNVRPLSFPSPFADRNDEEVASQVAMDNGPEVHTEFDGEEDESVLGIVDRVHVNPAKSRALGDGNSSTVSQVTKDSDSVAVPWRSMKSLVEIVKEIDEYFLKAAASGNDVVILLDSAGGRPDALEMEANKGNMCPCTIIMSIFFICQSITSVHVLSLSTSLEIELINVSPFNGLFFLTK
jgi:hypothetical protein